MDTLQALQYLGWKIQERLHFDERGQTAAEYMGIIVIVAAIFAAIAGTNIDDTIARNISTKIGEIFGGGGAPAGPAQPPG